MPQAKKQINSEKRSGSNTVKKLNWKARLELYLTEEGLAPSRAKKLVEISARPNRVSF
jgi:hypothetical protein